MHAPHTFQLISIQITTFARVISQHNKSSGVTAIQRSIALADNFLGMPQKIDVHIHHKTMVM